MEFTDVIATRRSIRKFKPDPVSDQHINRLLEAARLAPSGTNLQPWRFVVVTGEEMREKVGACTPLKFVGQAPLVIVCCMHTGAMKTTGTRVAELKEAGAFAGSDLENLPADEYKKFRRAMDSEIAVQGYLGLNTAIAIEHIVLQATDLGLGSCWVMMFSRDKVKEVLGLPEEITPLVLLPIGYPDQNPGPRPRLPLEELVVKRL